MHDDCRAKVLSLMSDAIELNLALVRLVIQLRLPVVLKSLDSAIKKIAILLSEDQTLKFTFPQYRIYTSYMFSGSGCF